MEKKKPTAQPAKTKTTVNKTAALKAADTHSTKDTKSTSSPKSKVPVVKDIDETSPDRK